MQAGKAWWLTGARLRLGLALAGLLQTSLLLAQQPAPRFHSVFGSNMVLPHDQALLLSGAAVPNVPLTLAVGSEQYHFSSDASGHWQARIKPLPAGGPYQLKLSSQNGASTTLDNVLAGEVWLCSGQSNMAFAVAASVDQPPAYNQGHPQIRLLTVAQNSELQPLADFAEPPLWQAATDDSIKRFSAVCYFFARKRFEHGGIPLGLVNSSWGGSAIEAWISEPGFKAVSTFGHKVDLLKQYRQNHRAAELAFADDWMQWWRVSSKQGAVWEQGVLDKSAEWIDAPLQNYKTYPDARLANHNAMLWFSRSFELTPQQQNKGATFVLGKIDEVDTTWLNGHFVNNSFGYGTKREYRLEPGLLKSGVNQFTVNVLNTYDAGGMTGPVEEVGIRFDNGEFVPLGTGWKYRFIPRETGYPPRSPWESVSGITGMFNGMIAPLQALPPAGVLWYQGESNAEASSTYQSLLTALISDWRRLFDNKTLPFIVMQLPNYGAVATTPVESGWATIRNAQQQVAIKDAQVGLVVTHDLGDDADIHPKRKYIVGERTAQVAEALRSKGDADGVVAKVASATTDKLVLEFKPALAKVKAASEIKGFSLCSKTKAACVFASARQTGSHIEISRDVLPAADTLRFCWSDGGHCELKAGNGLPVSSFELELPH